MALLCLALAATPLAAHATTTYTYTGVPYDFVSNGGPMAIYASTMDVSGSFTLAAPLQANLALSTISTSLLSFSFSDGVQSATSATTSFGTPLSGSVIWTAESFQVATDATGHISAWNISFQILPNPDPNFYSLLSTKSSGFVADSAQQSFDYYDTQWEQVRTELAQAQATSPGTWQVSGTVLPVPEPASLSLLAAAIAGLGMIRGRSRSSACGGRKPPQAGPHRPAPQPSPPGI